MLLEKLARLHLVVNISNVILYLKIKNSNMNIIQKKIFFILVSQFFVVDSCTQCGERKVLFFPIDKKRIHLKHKR